MAEVSYDNGIWNGDVAMYGTESGGRGVIAGLGNGVWGLLASAVTPLLAGGGVGGIS